MIDLTWFVLGVLTAGSIIYYLELAKQYHLDWKASSGYGFGIILVLFSIAWAVGAVLEGVPRAGSMGILLFGMPGIGLLTFIFRYIFGKLEKKEGAQAVAQSQEPEEKTVSTTPPLKPLKLPQFSASVSRGIRYAAYFSLLVAFILGNTSTGKDYETMILAKFEGLELTKVNDEPPVFQVGEKVNGKGEYILITEGQGYGGPFVLGIRIKDDAKVHEVIPLDDKETPAFLKKVREANYRDQFIGRGVADNFIVGDDIDAVSGATITTMAATQAVRNGAHIAALQYFKLEPTWEKMGWKFGLGEVLILIIFALAFIPRVSQEKPLKYIYLAATIGIVGFYLNAAISIGNLSGLLMGYLPGVKEHLIWWILVVGTVLGILFLGKNIYCFRICPFYGIQYLLSRISGNKWNPSPEVLKRSRTAVNFLLWLSLMIIFLSRLPAAGAYEPFAMMFSLEGVGIQWYILPLALIGSFFMSTFWCRFFCPTGNAFTNLLKLRKYLLGLVKKG
jgi:hypothetical protein